ncbi:unnamed protein product [Nezara viridula]|uniref:Uncharacterized protein n=1 Tax=Nezara viridula TaxID=85310 RepID=A0A9P0E9L3_NEZVI|nr:unnamed protein product [Nezara viridula]
MDRSLRSHYIQPAVPIRGPVLFGDLHPQPDDIIHLRVLRMTLRPVTREYPRPAMIAHSTAHEHYRWLLQRPLVFLERLFNGRREASLHQRPRTEFLPADPTSTLQLEVPAQRAAEFPRGHVTRTHSARSSAPI